MKKFITSLICFVALMLFEPVVFGTPIDIGKTKQKVVVKDSIVKNVSIQQFIQFENVCLDTPPDVGKVYSANINLHKNSEYKTETFITSKADFKVGWQLKGDQSIKIYKEKNPGPKIIMV